MQPMMLFLKKRQSLNPLSSLPHLSSSLTSATHNPTPKSQFVKDYLIESCGLSPEKAATASKHIHFTSTSKPDSVRHFLKYNAGFTNANIISIVNRNFYILQADVDKTIEPNLKALRRITTWSSSEIQQLVVTNPIILGNPHAISRLEFWKNFLNGDMEKLLLAAKRNLGLFCYDVDKGTVAQKIALLKEYGFSQIDIGSILVMGCGFFRRGIASMEVVLKKVEELGLPRGSRRFMHCSVVLSKIGPNGFMAKMNFYKRYGWSEKEFLAAFSKSPNFLILSEDYIRAKVDLLERAGCDQSYIASNPVILMYSLEKRLVPRLHVMNILTSHNLLGRMGLSRIMALTESQFIERFILQNKEEVPELHDIYTAACADQVPLIREGDGVCVSRQGISRK